jgi:hypothetical protein
MAEQLEASKPRMIASAIEPLDSADAHIRRLSCGLRSLDLETDIRSSATSWAGEKLSNIVRPFEI